MMQMSLDLQDLQVRSCGLSAEDVSLAHQIVETVRDTFIGGSYITNPESANDIDIIISAELDYKAVAEHFGMERQAVGSEISQEYLETHAIVAIYLKGSTSLLVVRPHYIPAYRAAVRDMRNDPELYQTREERIDLHKHYRKQIEQMMG